MEAEQVQMYKEPREQLEGDLTTEKDGLGRKIYVLGDCHGKTIAKRIDELAKGMKKLASAEFVQDESDLHHIAGNYLYLVDIKKYKNGVIKKIKQLFPQSIMVAFGSTTNLSEDVLNCFDKIYESPLEAELKNGEPAGDRRLKEDSKIKELLRLYL